jgi:Fe-S-cluster containining protein
MKDGALKTAVKLAARLKYLADLKVTRWIKAWSGEPYYLVTGDCRRCGQCCRTPVIPVYPLLFYLPLFKQLMIWWHRSVNGFELIRAERRAGLMVFRCTHWDSHTGLCDAYRSRPGMCCDYPHNLAYSADPELFANCGYQVILKNAAQMARALEEAGLPAQTLADLKARLHVSSKTGGQHPPDNVCKGRRGARGSSKK